MKMQSHDQRTCAECGEIYRDRDQAEYCARADADPRKENHQIRAGLLATRWIPKPIRKE